MNTWSKPRFIFRTWFIWFASKPNIWTDEAESKSKEKKWDGSNERRRWKLPTGCCCENHSVQIPQRKLSCMRSNLLKRITSYSLNPSKKSASERKKRKHMKKDRMKYMNMIAIAMMSYGNEMLAWYWNLYTQRYTFFSFSFYFSLL